MWLGNPTLTRNQYDELLLVYIGMFCGIIRADVAGYSHDTAVVSIELANRRSGFEVTQVAADHPFTVFFCERTLSILVN